MRVIFWFHMCCGCMGVADEVDDFFFFFFLSISVVVVDGVCVCVWEL